MQRFKFICKIFGSGNVKRFGGFSRECETRMIAVISIERRCLDSGLKRVVVGEFCKGKEGVPIVLLIVAEYAEILLNDLVQAFCLAVCLRMKRS